ncbi:MAG TPA: hypothetical protein VL547_18190, partial [Dinghuibacter sp.]|uniref:hypothetical protein n=1 Tax=Dinghuibacter sp. TaxID=2024697 RepID=UPI002C00484A
VWQKRGKRGPTAPTGADHSKQARGAGLPICRKSPIFKDENPNPDKMKTFRIALLALALSAALYSCAPKYGCPANAVGSENAENGHQHHMSSNLRKF